MYVSAINAPCVSMTVPYCYTTLCIKVLDGAEKALFLWRDTWRPCFFLTGPTLHLSCLPFMMTFLATVHAIKPIKHGAEKALHPGEHLATLLLWRGTWCPFCDRTYSSIHASLLVIIHGGIYGKTRMHLNILSILCPFN